jgi:glycerol-3-phosphate dehydrogenase (NAD(P)+)
MTSESPVAVIGGGSWGTALAIHLSRLGISSWLWVRNAELVELIRSRRENPWYLPGVALPASVNPTGDFREALGGVDVAIFAVPSHVFRDVLTGAGGWISRTMTLLSATKGLDGEGPRRMSEILAEVAPGSPAAVLSGPTFAREVALGQPTAAVVAASDPVVSARLQRRLASREFRLYTNGDVLGVELGGAVKNVMAIGTGLSDGLGLGENARAALITRGLAEITRLGVALGALPRTFAGLAGLGDLVLTCTGTLSRNRRLGLALAAGKRLEEAQAETRMVAEGVRTVTAVLALARRAGVPMPISQEVAAVLFEGKPPSDALTSLLQREVRAEEEALPERISTGSR